MTATQAGQPAKDPEDGGPGEDRRRRHCHVRSPATLADAGRLTRLTGGDAGRRRTAERIAALRARLMTPMPDDRLWGWIGPLLVTAFAGFLRFNRLSVPNAVIFDETYYAKDAWSILQARGRVEHARQPREQLQLAEQPDHRRAYQHLSRHARAPAAASTWSSRRSASCSSRSASGSTASPRSAGGSPRRSSGRWPILVMCRVARRLTRSTLLGCTAGLLLSLDGLEFVLSRTGILDIFLMFFVLAAFGALVVDRDVSRGAAGRGGGAPAGRRGGARARDQEVAGARPGMLIGLACAYQAVRRLVHPRLRGPVHRLGHRRAPHGRAARATCAARWCGTASGCRSPSA